MIKKVLALYWGWRIQKNEEILSSLRQLQIDVELANIDDGTVRNLIATAEHANSSAELQLLKCKGVKTQLT